MTFKLRIQITYEPNHEIPDGVYMDRSITLPDRLWGETLKEVKSLLGDAEEYEV